MEITTKSAEETHRLGTRFSADLKGGEIFALTGELGSGKTTFVQGFAEGLGVKRIISPTFILLRHYPVASHKSLITNFYHIDLYRLEEGVEDELVKLGVKDFIGKKENIVVVEWADKEQDFWPKETAWVGFDILGVNRRRVKIGR